MNRNRILFALCVALLFSVNAWSQASEICSDTGGGAPVWLNAKVVFGKVVLNGGDDVGRPLKVTVSVVNGARVLASMPVDQSGNYCFRDVDGSGATIIVEVEGREAGRETLESGTAPKMFRRDFELQLGRTTPKRPLISAKYPYTRNDHNSKLYADAESALGAKDNKKAEQVLKELVAADPKDFAAWSLLGSVYIEQENFPAAEKAFQSSLDTRADFAPAMMGIGRVYLVQKRVDDAIAMLLKATKAEPNSAMSFRLLGEAYLLARKGTLGVEALNEAIRLAPVPMAECHLLMALLYDRAGGKSLASREYRLFLEKVPNHPDKKKFEKYIQDNPETPE